MGQKMNVSKLTLSKLFRVKFEGVQVDCDLHLWCQIDQKQTEYALLRLFFR